MARCMTANCGSRGQVLWRVPFTEIDDSGEPATKRINVWLCLEHFNDMSRAGARLPLDRPFAFEAS